METTNVVIRPPGPADARELAEVHIAAWRAAYRGVMSDEFLDGIDVERRESGWRLQIEDPREGTAYLVAETASRIAGFVIVGPPVGDADAGSSADDGASPANRVGQLYAINLHPDLWARGIGTLLLRAAEDRLRGLGYTSAYLWVEQSNERAIAFYIGAGWAADGGTKEDTAYSPPVTVKRYRKNLS
ncbi:GNAT family N-acetyltransferase [Arthrobacter castelli]|uniref:GNAT family N-acetyltransferase n=1 Tax=Arthrobacter castelli TaxID=271431 RepID=UPI000410E371|nr:GNAT family N-acetyltransferase [Arthrobacter castelli]